MGATVSWTGASPFTSHFPEALLACPPSVAIKVTIEPAGLAPQTGAVLEHQLDLPAGGTGEAVFILQYDHTVTPGNLIAYINVPILLVTALIPP